MSCTPPNIDVADDAPFLDAEYLAFVQQSIDSADRGDLIPHDEVMAELKARIRAHRLAS